MKAVVYTEYGPPGVLHLQEVEKPVPKADEILIKVYATTVTAGDVRTRAFKVPFWQWVPARIYLGLARPKRSILGMEVAGEVEEAGRDVTRFKPGDRVFAFAGFGFGAYAEYLCLTERGNALSDGAVAMKPANITYEEAAAATGGALTALALLRKCAVAPGQNVLIYGASGSIGTFAVQLAKVFGARVTGVCSTSNLDMVRSLGADRVIDYTQEDFSKTGETYDLIFDAVAKCPRAKGKRALNRGGTFVSSHESLGSTRTGAEDLDFLRQLVEAGRLRSVIDRCYPFEQIVAAHQYVEQGHKKGNVVITVRSMLPQNPPNDHRV